MTFQGSMTRMRLVWVWFLMNYVRRWRQAIIRRSEMHRTEPQEALWRSYSSKQARIRRRLVPPYQAYGFSTGKMFFIHFFHFWKARVVLSAECRPASSSCCAERHRQTCTPKRWNAICPGASRTGSGRWQTSWWYDNLPVHVREVPYMGQHLCGHLCQQHHPEVSSPGGSCSTSRWKPESNAGMRNSDNALSSRLSPSKRAAVLALLHFPSWEILAWGSPAKQATSENRISSFSGYL